VERRTCRDGRRRMEWIDSIFREGNIVDVFELLRRSSISVLFDGTCCIWRLVVEQYPLNQIFYL
jgi:hypothetical protein